MLHDDCLNQLCDALGVEREYWDIFGNHCPASRETKLRILESLGYLVQSDSEGWEALRNVVVGKYESILPAVVLFKKGVETASVEAFLPEGKVLKSIRYILRSEDGNETRGEISCSVCEALSPRAYDDRRWQAFSVPLPRPNDCGYHRLQFQFHVDDEELEAETLLLYAPEACYLPSSFKEGERLFGISLQLYSLRGERSWGIGDFADLRGALPIFKRQGIDLVGLNPLHALFSSEQGSCSPYAPNTRLAWNFLYLSIYDLEDFHECQEAQEFAHSEGTKQEINRLQSLGLIDYSAVLSLKVRALRLLYQSFRKNHLAANTPRAEEFQEFFRAHSESLERYALHETLQAHFSEISGKTLTWQSWPPEFQNINSEEISKFAALHEEQLQFFLYIQWLTHREIEGLSLFCTQLGMKIGLYTDMALGSDAGGAEVWSNQNCYAKQMSMGAPPDELGPLGQDWGLPPLLPSALFAADLKPFILALRRSMHGASAIRIDHVMSLYRLFWVPHGSSAKDGAYVRYPFQLLLAAVAIESQRNKCFVIGEDLGTVPDEVRSGMTEYNILSYKVLFFQKNRTAFLSPAEYPAMSLAVTSTHDLATLAGFWSGHDLETREKLGLYLTPEIRARVFEERGRDRRGLLELLSNEGLVESDSIEEILDGSMTPELSRKLHVVLGRSESLVQTFQLEDVLLQMEQANVPGTVDEHPNWRRRMNGFCARVWESENFRLLCAEISQARTSIKE